mgnify:CR=1 FL=1
MFAIIEVGGSQHKVQVGDKFLMNPGCLDSRVLYAHDGKKSHIGRPVVEGARVDLKVVEETRGPKILVFKKKRRQGYRRMKGHKQHLVRVEVTDVKV